MPRSPGLAGPSEGGSAPGRARPVRSAGRSKACAFCHDPDLLVDYKDTALLRRFISDRGRIRPRRVSGTCARHQIEVAAAIKTARELALLPSVPPTGRVRIDTEERAAEGAGAPTMEKVDA